MPLAARGLAHPDGRPWRPPDLRLNHYSVHGPR